MPELDRRADGEALVSATASDGSDTQAVYNPQLTDVTDQHGHHRGRLVVFRDVTAQQRRLDRIEALQAATEGLIDARIDDEIAEVAVSFVDRILAQEVAVVFLADEDGEQLRPAAVSDAIEDVFEIILQNAVEHNDAEQPHVEVEVVYVGDWIQVHVADNGPGVSDHFKESLFEQDVSVSETAHGFELYFVALILALFEGDIWFEDNEPRGAIAILEFQRAPEE